MNGQVLAAISPQWIGIAVASAIVVALLVILVVRRAADGKSSQAAPPPGESGNSLVEVPESPKGAGSFLDEPLQKGFDGLGKPASGQPALGTIVMPKGSRPGPPQPEPAESVGPTASVEPPAVGPVAPLETSVAPLVPGSDPGQEAPTPAYEAPPEQAAEAVPEPPGSPEQPAVDEASPVDSGAAPLSEIIVTTNQQEIDLTDPEVREMLEELVASEIALAEAYRQQGQILDAILQLTEAEKACTALGDAAQAERIKALMKDLQP